MATCANTDVKVRYLDEWPAGVTDAIVTALCARALSLTDSKVGAVGTFDHTTAEGIEFDVDVVVQLIEYAKWAHAGKAVDGIPPPPRFTREMLDRLETILQDSDSDGMDLIDTHDPNVS